MRKIHVGRLLPTLSLLAVGFILGGTFADAGNGKSPVFELETYDQVLDTDAKIVVEDGQGFVLVNDKDGRQVAKVEVRGWNTLVKRRLIDADSIIRVTGANDQGKKVEYRGHVTVLK